MYSALSKSFDLIPIIVMTAVFAMLLLFFLFFGENKKISDKTGCNFDTNNTKDSKKKQPKSQNEVPRKRNYAFSHTYLHTTLKGHTGSILDLDLSINGKYIVSCSEDRSVMLWSIKELGKGNKSIRVNVQYDHANQVKFSPDSRAFLLGLHHGNTVRVYKLDKKDDGISNTFTPLEKDFPKYSKADLLSIGIGITASGGHYIMTAYKDTTISIRDLKGCILHTVNTNQGNNLCALVSPCGRFFASGGWAPDVKVWTVVFDRNGSYNSVHRAFELKGHASSVWSFDFNNDSSRIITASKDGYWRLFDSNIEYENGQEPYLLHKGELTFQNCSIKDNPAIIALSPDANVGAVACVTSLKSFSTNTGKSEVEMRDVHSNVISAVKFDIAGKFIFSAGDKHVRVFHNTLGYKEVIRNLEEKLKYQSTSSATRERLQKQIDEATKTLKEVNQRWEQPRKKSNS